MSLNGCTHFASSREVVHWELQDRIEEAEIQDFDHELIRENLRKFKETFSVLTDEEKPECLQLILKDIILSRDTIQLNIFDLPGFNYESSKNRTHCLLRWCDTQNFRRGVHDRHDSKY